MKAFFALMMILSVSFYAQAGQLSEYDDSECPFNQPPDWTVVNVTLSDWEEWYISTLPCPYRVAAITHIAGHPLLPHLRIKICEYKECVCPPEGKCCPVVDTVKLFFTEEVRIPVDCQCTC